MVLMAAFLTQVGALQTAPILIAVVIAFLTMDAVKYFMASRSRRTQPRRNRQLRLEATEIGWGHIAVLIFASSGLICTPVAPATISAPPPTAKYPHQGDS